MSEDRDVSRLVHGNIEDLRNSLRHGGEDRELLVRALFAARELNEGKCKVQMIERAIRKIDARNPSPMPKAKSSSLLLADAQIYAPVQISNLQTVALQQFKLIGQLHRDAALRALLVGFALHRIKAGLKHGQFMPWIKKDFDATGYRQANYYMRLATMFAEHSRLTKPELLALPVDSTELALDSTDAAARKFMEKAHKFVGEKSLNELLDEHGIKDAKKLGGARDKGTGAAEALDPEQLYLFSRDEIGGAIARAEDLLVKENRLQHLVGHPDEIRGVVVSLRALADRVEAAAKPILKKEAK